MTNNLWMILAAGLVTATLKVAGFGLGGRTVPPVLERFLTYVPVAVFAALIAPDLGIGGDEWPPRLLGVLIAGVAVWRTSQLWVGLTAGMAVYWILRGLGG